MMGDFDCCASTDIENLREVRAKAWAEGEASGWSRAMRKTSDEPNLSRQTNPYRETNHN